MRLHLCCLASVALTCAVHADRILFVASNATDKIDTLFTINPDGSDVQRVYTNTIRAWSPDLVGTHLTNAEIVFTDITSPFIGTSCGFPVIYNGIPDVSALSGLLLIATAFWCRTRH